VHVSARVDYAVRALLVLAESADRDPRALVKGDAIAREQRIPVKFLEGILRQLRHPGIVASMRGAEGGYRLARPASEIDLAWVVRVLDGPLGAVRGEPPEDAEYEGAAENLRDVWVAARAALRLVLEQVTLEDVRAGTYPTEVVALLDSPGAWERR
jgi:Rrf2 family protein